ncbi:MAG: hypothetical protein ACXWG8_07720 [Usitatibacter sp.]
MSNMSEQRAFDTDEQEAEQAAKALFNKLADLRRRHADDQISKRGAQSFRQRLIDGMNALGYVEMVHAVESFMRDIGQTTTDHNEAQGLRCWKLIERKFRELEEAHWAEIPEEELNAGIDLIWSVIALLLSHGHDVRGAFTEVTRANEDKVPAPGEEIRSSNDGVTVAKPAGWKPPQLAEYVGF